MLPARYALFRRAGRCHHRVGYHRSATRIAERERDRRNASLPPIVLPFAPVRSTAYRRILYHVLRRLAGEGRQWLFSRTTLAMVASGTVNCHGAGIWCVIFIGRFNITCKIQVVEEKYTRLLHLPVPGGGRVFSGGRDKRERARCSERPTRKLIRSISCGRRSSGGTCRIRRYLSMSVAWAGPDW